MTTVPTFCSVDGCERLVRARGMCVKHYERWRRNGSVELPPLPPRCEVLGCKLPARMEGRCRLHFGAQERGPVDWVNPLVCVCEEPDADPAVDFGECAICRRIPVALMHGRFAPEAVAS